MPRRCSTRCRRPARGDAGYIFARVQWLRKDNKPEEAGKLILTAPKDPEALVDLDQWWLERRLLVRKLLDDNDAANRLSRGARGRLAAARQLPRRPAFHRRLDRAALPARSGHRRRPFRSYHRRHRQSARAGARRLLAGPRAEAMGQRAQAKAYYETAAQYTATYYGQLARARLGLADLGLRGPPLVHAGGAERSRQSRSRARGGNSLRARRARHAGVDLCRARRKRHRHRRHGALRKSPASTATAAPCCCSARAPMGAACRSNTTPIRSSACPDSNPIHTDRRTILDRPPGEPLQPEGRLDRPCHGLHAGDAGGSAERPPRHSGALQSRPVCSAIRSTTCKWAPPNSPCCCAPITAPIFSPSPATMPGAAACGSGSPPMAIRATQGRSGRLGRAHPDRRDPQLRAARIMENLQVYRARFGGGNHGVDQGDLKRGAESGCCRPGWRAPADATRP